MPHLPHTSPGLTLLCVGVIHLLFMSSSAHAQESQKSLYNVSWHDASVARLSLHVGCPSSTHTPAALIASSTGLADDLHSFSIRLDSFIPFSSSLPLQGRTRITEEERTRAYISSFTPDSVSVDTTLFGEKKKTATHDLPSPSHDLLSWMLDLGDALKNTSFSSKTYTVWDGWKLVKIRAKLLPKDSIVTPLGTFTDAHVLHLTRTRIDLKGKPIGDSDELGTVWFSQAPSPQLVAMDFASRMGLATIRLVKRTATPCTP